MDYVAIRLSTQQVIYSDFIFVFIPCFFGLVFEKMELRKNIKNGRMSRPCRVLSIEEGFKPLQMNCSAVDQIGQV